MKVVTIGRDNDTNKLRVIVGGKAMTSPDYGIVPKSVGREHVSITIDDNGELTLRNLNIENDTYVNGRGVETKQIKKGDCIELGQDRFRIKQELLDALLPKYADIRPLKNIIDKYKRDVNRINDRQKHLNVLSTIPFGISLLAGTAIVIIPDIAPIASGVTILSAIVWLYGLYLRMTDNSLEQREKLKDDFERKCVCPNCGYFLGNQSYYLISKNTACPSCHAIYKK